jgi:hypothetical protein
MTIGERHCLDAGYLSVDTTPCTARLCCATSAADFHPGAHRARQSGHTAAQRLRPFLRALARYPRSVGAEAERAFVDDEIVVVGVNTAPSNVVKTGASISSKC